MPKKTSVTDCIRLGGQICYRICDCQLLRDEAEKKRTDYASSTVALHIGGECLKSPPLLTMGQQGASNQGALKG